MRLDNKSINRINLQDMENLIKDQEPESKNLEYKGEIQGKEETKVNNF